MKQSRQTPWAYRKGSTVLHRLPAGAKLLCLLLLSMLAFFPSLLLLGAIALAIVLLSFIAGINPASLLRGSGPLLLIVLGVFLFQAIELFPFGIKLDGLKESLIFCIRIAAAFSAGALLFAVTTGGEIRKSLCRAESVLRLEKFKTGLYISLMLMFLPQFFQVWEDLNLSWKSRAGKPNIARLKKLLPIAMEKMMIKAAETAAAMEARGGSIEEIYHAKAQRRKEQSVI